MGFTVGKYIGLREEAFYPYNGVWKVVNILK
jgi:hypothetical protein